MLQQAVAIDPGLTDAWAPLGLSCEALAQWPAAVDSLTQAVSFFPEHAVLWLAYGRCQLRLNSVESALRAFDRAVAVSPSMAQAWSERGGLLRELNRLEEAALCFEKALSLGADPVVHDYYLAAVRGTGAPAAPPRQYVEALFDEYASDFHEHLVEELQYQAHESLVGPLVRSARRYEVVLDLGCGTGLCGKLIHPLAETVNGVDVSNAMLEQARQLGVYNELAHADLISFLAETSRKADLVLAADVFIYVGELSAVFQSVRSILNPTGCFAFTVERTEQQDVQLLPSLRYRHSEKYVRQLAQAHGFSVRDFFTAPLRYDQMKPVQGFYVYLGL